MSVLTSFLMQKELWIMPNMEKPNARGPSPGDKAQKALGKKLNRPAKPPPTMPGRKAKKNEPLARRTTDEVHDL